VQTTVDDVDDDELTFGQRHSSEQSSDEPLYTYIVHTYDISSSLCTCTCINPALIITHLYSSNDSKIKTVKTRKKANKQNINTVYITIKSYRNYELFTSKNDI